MENNNHLLSVLYKHWGIFAVVVFVQLLYAPIISKFFEQDEWHNFGWQIYSIAEHGVAGHIWNLVHTSLPIAQLYNFINFYFFGIFSPFPAVVVLILLICNCFLWYKIWLQLSGRKLIAAGSVLFGYTSILSMQSVTWVIPAFSTQGSFFLLNVCLLLFLKYLEQKRKISLLIAAILVLMLAVFTKQNTFFLIFYLPIIFIKEGTFSFTRKSVLRIGLIFSVAVLFAVSFFYIKLGAIEFGTSRYTSSPVQVVANAFFLPTKSISQLVINNPKHLYSFTDWLVLQRYTLHVDQSYMQKLAVENISMWLSLILLIPVALGYKYIAVHQKPLLCAGSFYFLAFAPFFIDKHSTGTGFLESRYYYLPAFALGVLIFIILTVAIDHIKRIHNLKLNALLLTSIIALIALYTYTNTQQISANLERSIATLQIRKEIIETISAEVLSKDGTALALYIEDTAGDTILNNNLTGQYFQTGLLYPTLVYTNKFSPYFFEDDTLWNYAFQGRSVVDGQQVAVYYQKEAFVTALNTGSISAAEVVAVSFDYTSANAHPDFQGNFYDLRFVEYEIITDTVLSELDYEE